MFAQKIKREYMFKELEQVAIRLLSRREHSRFELFTKLSNYTDQIDLINCILDHCIEQNYLNNQRYADSYLRMRSAKGFGLLRITQELLDREISKAQIRQACKNEPQDWFELASNTYNKKYKNHLKVQQETFELNQRERAKRYRFMSYRGFTQEQIHFALS